MAQLAIPKVKWISKLYDFHDFHNPISFSIKNFKNNLKYRNVRSIF